MRAASAALRCVLSTRKVELLSQIARKKALGDELIADLKAAADQFKQTWN